MFWFIIILALGLYIAYDYWYKPRSAALQQRPRQSFSEIPPPDKTGHELLIESTIWDRFNQEFVFIMPTYGLYKGKKIPMDEITQEMMMDPAFVRPADLGQWLQRNPDESR